MPAYTYRTFGLTAEMDALLIAYATTRGMKVPTLIREVLTKYIDEKACGLALTDPASIRIRKVKAIAAHYGKPITKTERALIKRAFHDGKISFRWAIEQAEGDVDKAIAILAVSRKVEPITVQEWLISAGVIALEKLLGQEF